MNLNNNQLLILGFVLLSISTHLIECQTRLTLRKKFTAANFTYDLAGSPPIVGGGGQVNQVTLDQMPALSGEGLTYFLFNLKPCGVILPHVHPRAAELIYAINAVSLQVGFTEENSGRTLVNNITTGMTALIPQGLMHFAQNIGCQNATFISALNSEDPGVSAVRNVLNFPTDAMAGAFNQTVDQIQQLAAAVLKLASPAQGIENCLKACGINSGKFYLDMAEEIQKAYY